MRFKVQGARHKATPLPYFSVILVPCALNRLEMRDLLMKKPKLIRR
jgi:hypothetical protein